MSLYSKKQLNYERSIGLELTDKENGSGVNCPQSLHPDDDYEKGKKLIYKNNTGYTIVLSDGLQGWDGFYGIVLESTAGLKEGDYYSFGKGFYLPYNQQSK